MINRKILNATPVIARDGIQLKSKMERTVYHTLLDYGFDVHYEPETFTYWEGFYPTVPFYDKDTKRNLRNNHKKILGMKYTPDFIFIYNGIKVLIEVKGWENDQFAIRKKMFRKYLETLDYPVIYAEIFSKRQLLEFIETLKNDYEC